MATRTGPVLPTPIDPAVRAREFKDLAEMLHKHPLDQPRLDAWVGVSTDRHYVLQDMFFGSIRWPKSIGRSSTGTLASGFSLKLRNHFNVYYVGAGGEVIDKDGYMDMPDPTTADVTDDAEHYKVVYSGWYAPYSLYIDRNELHVAINGAWTTPSPRVSHRFLLPKPTGFIFGSFDGHPIVLDEITVEEHLLRSESAWSIKM
jgi:hypothetical protein